MPLRPEDIENREFTTSLRGFDRHEVKAFLRRVAADVRELEYQLIDSVAESDEEPFEAMRASAPPLDLDGFGVLGDRIAELLRQAHDVAADTTRSADEYAAARRSEADDELEAARVDAGRIREEAESERDAVWAEIERARSDAEAIREEAEAEASGIRNQAEADGLARLAERESEIARIEADIVARRNEASAEVADAKAQVSRLLEEARAQSDFIRYEADEIIRGRIRDTVDKAQKRIELLRNTEIASRNRILTAQQELEAALGRLEIDDLPEFGPDVEAEVLEEAERKAIDADLATFHPVPDPVDISADEGDDEWDEDAESPVEVFEAEVFEAAVIEVTGAAVAEGVVTEDVVTEAVVAEDVVTEAAVADLESAATTVTDREPDDADDDSDDVAVAEVEPIDDDPDEVAVDDDESDVTDEGDGPFTIDPFAGGAPVDGGERLEAPSVDEPFVAAEPLPATEIPSGEPPSTRQPSPIGWSGTNPGWNKARAREVFGQADDPASPNVEPEPVAETDDLSAAQLFGVDVEERGGPTPMPAPPVPRPEAPWTGSAMPTASPAPPSAPPTPPPAPPSPPTPPNEDDLARLVREAMQKVVDGARREEH